MINYIGLDTSLTSTGMYIKTPTEEHYFNYRNHDKLSKWHKTLSFVNYYDYKLEETTEFSQEQIAKLKAYDQITDKIIADMLSICDPKQTVVLTESYSYASSAGPLIDLVTYATLLRSKILKHGFIELIVIPPTSLKSKTALKVYGPGPLVGKKVKKETPARNHLGIPGGKFKKPEMLEAGFDSGLNAKIIQALLIHKDEILKMKAIPSPVSDLIDAFWLVEAYL